MAPPPPRSAPAPAPEILEVRCAGCGETLEVEAGLMEFVCPDCAMPQALPPELMPPPPPRRRRALPLPRGDADARGARLPCAACGAVLSVPHGLGRFACPLCGVELAVDRTLLRQYLASSAASAVSVVAPPAAVPLTSPPEVQEAPPSQAIRVGQVQVEPYNQPSSVEQAQVEHPSRANYLGRAQLEPLNHSSHREEAHVEPLNESISRTSRKKTRFPVGPESLRVEKVQVKPPNQVIHAPPAQGGPANYSVHTDQAQVQHHSEVIAGHGKQKTGCAVEPSAIYMEQEQIEPLNQAVHVQQTKETPNDEAHAEQVQVEPRSKTNGWNRKRKKKGLMSSSNEGPHLRRSKRLAKVSVGLIDSESIQQTAASPDQNLSHPPDIERIIANLRPCSLPQHQMPQASNESDNRDLTTRPASSNPGISQGEQFPCYHSQLYPPEVNGALAKPSSNSLHEHQMPQPSSSGRCRLDVTEPQLRPDSQQTQPPRRPSGLNAGNGHLHMEQEQVEPLNQVIHGRQAQEPSSDENHSKQVQVVSLSKNIAAHHKQKKKGLMGSSNEGSHLGDRSFSGTCRQMTLAAACSRLAASLPLPTSTSSPTTTSPSVLTTPPLHCRRLSPSHSQPSSHLDSQVSLHPSLSVSGTRCRRSKRRRQPGPAQVAATSTGHPLPVSISDHLRHRLRRARSTTRNTPTSSGGEEGGSSTAAERYRSRAKTGMGERLSWESRPVLTPTGSRQWVVEPLKGSRVPATVLGPMVRAFYPNIVGFERDRRVARRWEDYKWTPDEESVPSAASTIKEEFWCRFKLAPGGDEAYADSVLEENCRERVKQMMYDEKNEAIARLYARGNVAEEEDEEGNHWPTLQEMLTVKPKWATQEAWQLLCEHWGSKKFRQQSWSAKRNRLSAGPNTVYHSSGSRTLTAHRQHMAARNNGVDPGFLAVWQRCHRMQKGTSNELCSQQAARRMIQYEEGMRNKYGDDWRTVHPDFDPVVMYQSTGGTPHGRFAIGDGAIERSVVASARSQKIRASQRHPSVQDNLRKENEELRARLSGMERMMQVMAERQGIDYRKYMYQPPDQGTSGSAADFCGLPGGDVGGASYHIDN